MSTGKPFSRLPTNVSPSKYVLSYDNIDLNKYTFDGKEKIFVTIHQTTKSIVCHAVDLWIRNAIFVRNDTNEEIKCHEIQYNFDEQTVSFQFLNELPSKLEGQLQFEFHGILNDELRGFYRSEYTSMDGKKRMMAVTQYEACDARRAFVCWDEPAIKAKYDITMVTPIDLMAISNTSVVSTNVRQGLNGLEKVWKFDTTPITSTYLIGMVVGEFDVISNYTNDGVHVSVYTPLGHSQRGTFALDVGVKALELFTKTFGIAYPLRKLDMLAIPDFAAGAMENWGIVTYRETRLLIDVKRSSIAQKTAVARTVCHELAHQWFGNLVTMEWWTSLWLNEGFARFMEFEAVDAIFPDWKVWEQFVQEITLTSAMKKDALKSTHQIEVEVHHPDEVDEIFDVISYAKGASLIRMLSQFLGRDIFYQGIQHYLNKFRYANATTNDLWEALEEISGKEIKEMMNTWTQQEGFPVVTLLDSKNNQLECSQRRLLMNEILNEQDSNTKTWHIPITMMTSQKQTQEITYPSSFLWKDFSNSQTKSMDEIHLKQLNESIQSAEWFLLNPEQSGFYLVNYTLSQWKLLEKPIREQKLKTIDRFSLLNTMFALARRGLIPISNAMTFSLAFQKDSMYLCWKELSQNISFYYHLFASDCLNMKKSFQKYIQIMYEEKFKELGWKNQENIIEDERIGLFRRTLLSIYSLTDNEEFINDVQKRFQLYMEAFLNGNTTSNTILPFSTDLRSVVFSICAKHGNRTIYEQLKKCYEQSDFIEEKLDVLGCLGKIPSNEIRLEVLNYAFQNVRSQDIQYVFGSVSYCQEGRLLAWDYVQTHWKELNGKYAPYIVGRIVQSVISGFKTKEKADEIQKFMNNRKHHSYERTLDGALENIRIKDAIIGRDEMILKKWFHDNLSKF